MTAEVWPDVDLEELLDNEIPCGGNRDPECSRSCDKAAVLRLHPHCSQPLAAYSFKCISCWQAWYVAASKTLARRGFLRHGHCGRIFYDVESFGDYRPF